jgi:hypothetical protein
LLSIEERNKGFLLLLSGMKDERTWEKVDQLMNTKADVTGKTFRDTLDDLLAEDLLARCSVVKKTDQETVATSLSSLSGRSTMSRDAWQRGYENGAQALSAAKQDGMDDMMLGRMVPPSLERPEWLCFPERSQAVESNSTMPPSMVYINIREVMGELV